MLTRAVLLGYNQALILDFRRRAMAALPKKDHYMLEEYKCRKIKLETSF